MIEFNDEIDKTLPGYRLITVSGRAGSGRTRLITTFGVRNIRLFPYGVYYIDLAGLTTQAELVARVTAMTLEVPLRNADNPAEIIAETLRDQQALLLFDNCDRLVPAVADLLDTLLARAPHVMALAVCNDALGIPGEIVRPVPGLTLPPPGETGIAPCEATDLFCEYAQAANEKFQIDAGNAALVNQVCRDLEGVPLAVILAASLLSEVTLDKLADQIRTQLPRAQGGRRTLKEHDHMLRSLTDWHHTSLDRAHKKTFRRISIFRGAFPLFYASFITGPYPELVPEVQKMLDGWIRKGLVTTDVGTRVLGKFGKPRVPAQTRYGLPRPVWSYAREELAANTEHQPIAEVRTVLLGGIFEMTRRMPEGTTPLEWAKRNQPDLENLYAALEFAQTSLHGKGPDGKDRSDFATNIARGLREFWQAIDDGAEQAQRSMRKSDMLRHEMKTPEVWDKMVASSRQAARTHQAD